MSPCKGSLGLTHSLDRRTQSRQEGRTHSMLDTEIKLAQCSRCQSYVWACNSAGVRVAVDPNPIMNGAEVYAFLGYGRSIYEVIYKVSKPHHLRWLGAPGTSWEPNGRILVASHGCGAAATDAVAVEVPLQ